MKLIQSTIIALALVLGSAVTNEAQAQKFQEAEFHVDGVCDMCKKRIEDAALVKGVRIAEWNKEAKSLKVTYHTKKASVEEIQQAVANAGHDTEGVKAPDEAYAEIPECCRYRDGVKTH